MLDYSTGTWRHGILIARKALNGISWMVPQRLFNFNHNQLTAGLIRMSPCPATSHFACILKTKNKTVRFSQQLIHVLQPSSTYFIEYCAIVKPMCETSIKYGQTNRSSIDLGTCSCLCACAGFGIDEESELVNCSSTFEVTEFANKLTSSSIGGLCMALVFWSVHNDGVKGTSFAWFVLKLVESSVGLKELCRWTPRVHSTLFFSIGFKLLSFHKKWKLANIQTVSEKPFFSSCDSHFQTITQK